MGNAEHLEAIKSNDSAQEGKSSSLSNYAMEPSAHIQASHDQSKGLIDKGVLPELSFLSSDVQHTGIAAGTQEIKGLGIKESHSKGGSTIREYPAGVRVETYEPSPSHGNITFGPTVGLEAEKPNHLNKNGEVEDPTGKVIAKINGDGSVTIDTGKGFYTQYPDGSIDKAAALRSRDGKNFDVIDVNSPLGDLRPSDLSVHHR